MFSRAEEIVQVGLDKGLYSAAALGIILNGKIVKEEYFGKLSFDENAEKVDKNTRFDLASLSKIISTTSIALRYLDRGLLRLGDKLSYFFPDATAAKKISIEQLLTHSSGEPSHFFLSAELNDPSGIRELLLHRELEYESGTQEKYSCMGFILLGEILKKIADASLDEIFKEEVIDTLSLESTSYGPLNISKIPVARTKDERSREVLAGIVHDENARFQGGISANAGLFSNLRDTMTYAQALLESCDRDNYSLNGSYWLENKNFETLTYKLQNGARSFISPYTMRLARKNYTPGMEEDRGLGFFLGSTKSSSFGDLFPNSFGHTGFTGTSILISPEDDLAVVFLSNRVIADVSPMELVRLRASLHNVIGAELSCLKSSF